MNPDDVLIGAIRRSRLFGALAGVRQLTVATFHASTIRRVLDRLCDRRAGHSETPPRLAGGIAVLTAVVTHLTLLLTLGEYRGWPMLLLPAAASLLAILAVLSGFAQRRPRP